MSTKPREKDCAGGQGGMNRLCACGAPVEPARLEIGLETCYQCALNVPRVKGVRVFTDKVTSDVVVVPEEEVKRHQARQPGGMGTECYGSK